MFLVTMFSASVLPPPPPSPARRTPQADMPWSELLIVAAVLPPADTATPPSPQRHYNLYRAPETPTQTNSPWRTAFGLWRTAFGLYTITCFRRRCRSWHYEGLKRYTQQTPSPPQRYYIYRAPEAPSEGELKVPVKAAGSRLRHKGAAEELPLSE